jgi:hypothetical protein
MRAVKSDAATVAENGGTLWITRAMHVLLKLHTPHTEEHDMVWIGSSTYY